MKKDNRSNIQGALLAIRFFTIVAIVVTGLVFFMHFSRPNQTYYVYNNNGAELQIETLAEPNVTSEALLNWASLAATTIHTIDYLTYEQHLEDIRDFFTIGGYNDYIATLKKSGTLDKIKREFVRVTAVTTNTPVVFEEGMNRGVYAWKLQVPLLLSYETVGAASTSTVAVNLLVERVPTDKAPKGIGIGQIIDTEMQGGI